MFLKFRYFGSFSLYGTLIFYLLIILRVKRLQKWQESRTIIYMFKDLLWYFKNIHKLNNLWLVNPRNNSHTRWCSYQFTVITLVTVFLDKAWIFHDFQMFFLFLFRLSLNLLNFLSPVLIRRNKVKFMSD